MAKISDKKLKQVRENYRKVYPKADLFFTSDGNCFLKKAMAEAHARKEKLDVISDLVTPVEKPAEGVDPKTGKKEALTEEKAKEVLADITLDDKADFALLGEIIEVLGVEGEVRSKADRIAALKPVQDELKGA